MNFQRLDYFGLSQNHLAKYSYWNELRYYQFFKVIQGHFLSLKEAQLAAKYH